MRSNQIKRPDQELQRLGYRAILLGWGVLILGVLTIVLGLCLKRQWVCDIGGITVIGIIIVTISGFLLGVKNK